MFFVINSTTKCQASPVWYPTMDAARDAADAWQKLTKQPHHIRNRAT